MSTTSWSLNNSIHETMDHYLSIQHHGLFSLIPYMRPGTTLSVYTTSWSLINHFIHEIRDHSICLYNTMVSYQQFHTWDHGPLYLSIKHHDLFSLIPYMRPGTTLSVYTTSWSLSTLSTHKTMDHSVCLYITMVSSHQFSAWDHHGLFSSVSCTRPVSILSVYTTTWSLLANSIYEIMDHFICLYNTMVSSHLLYSWDHGPLYLSIQHHGLFSPIPYMRPGTTLSIQHHGLFSPIPYMRPVTTLSVYSTSWSLLTNPIHENRDHSICLYNTVISSH